MAKTIVYIEAKAFEELSKYFNHANKIETHNFIYMPKESGLPLGFKFPFNEILSWNNCCDALREQGWKITKD